MAMSGLGIGRGIRRKESKWNEISLILPDARATATSAEPATGSKKAFVV
jgi:hypothetical protein